MLYEKETISYKEIKSLSKLKYQIDTDIIGHNSGNQVEHLFVMDIYEKKTVVKHLTPDTRIWYVIIVTRKIWML